MTKRFKWSALMLCLFGLLILGLVARNSRAVAGVEIKGGSSHNLGAVPGHALIRHTVILHNPNKVPVSIAVPPSPGCACVTAVPAEANILARGTMPIQLKIEPEGEGESTKAVRVITTRSGSQARETWLYITYSRPAKAKP